MLTKVAIRNFKQFADVEVELGERVLLVGPSNSGKTTALQALALWELGVKRWLERRSGPDAPKKRTGVAISRRDLLAAPHPHARHLWRNLRVREQKRVKGKPNPNVRIEVVVDGIANDCEWRCGMEFDYANEEIFHCRPLKLGSGRTEKRMPVPREAAMVNVAFLPSMSGLASSEALLDPGALKARIGEGRTAEVLRNLCWLVWLSDKGRWKSLVESMGSLFGLKLDDPAYIAERGEITLGYREREASLDLSSSGRGFQQTLLILAYMYGNPGSVMLLDEPDAHLEILRQRQIYDEICGTAARLGSQVIVASHSEALLNEATGRDLVVAFIGKPHSLAGTESRARRAFAGIGYELCFQAQQKGWVLFLEGSTDLAILKSFARRLRHSEAARALDRPFVCYVGNQPVKAQNLFHGLREAVEGLAGVALFDKLEREGVNDKHMDMSYWRKREIENYFGMPETLVGFACKQAEDVSYGPLFKGPEIERRVGAMEKAIAEVQRSFRSLKGIDPWSDEVKVSDEVLDPVFNLYYEELDLPNLMSKSGYHVLAEFVPEDRIDSEIGEKLDAIAGVAARARPKGDDIGA